MHNPRGPLFGWDTRGFGVDDGMRLLTPSEKGAVRLYFQAHPKATEEAMAKRFDLPVEKIREALHG